MSFRHLGQIFNPSEITILGHGEGATDKGDFIRNNTSASGAVKIDILNEDLTTTSAFVIKELPAGFIYPVRVSRVYETGTSLATVEIGDLR